MMQMQRSEFGESELGDHASGEAGDDQYDLLELNKSPDSVVIESYDESVSPLLKIENGESMGKLPVNDSVEGLIQFGGDLLAPKISPDLGDLSLDLVALLPWLLSGCSLSK
jgi:hypothetical protein